MHVVRTDGGGGRTLAPTGDMSSADEPVWRPPDGHQLVIRGFSPAGIGLYLAAVDDPAAPVLISEVQAPRVAEYAWISASFTAAGDAIVTQRYTGDPDVDTGAYRVVVLDLKPGAPTVANIRDRNLEGIDQAIPQLSPDESAICCWARSPAAGSRDLCGLDR